jgi:tetratricopeptide (TPR) repeat protein
MVPFGRDNKFVGREDILSQIEERLQVGRRVSIAGIGGVGYGLLNLHYLIQSLMTKNIRKSQIAIEYAYRLRKKRPEIQIFWVYAATYAGFEKAYQDIAEKLKIPGRDDPKLNKMELIQNWLSERSHGHWLMILDNADKRSLFFPTIDVNTSYESNTQSHLADYLPLSSIEHGFLVITTRNKKLGSELADEQDPIEVQPFEPADALVLLESKTLKGYWDVAVARDLLEVLGYMPLAITQAAAYMRQNRVSMGKYLKALSRSDSNLVGHLTTELLDPRRQRDTPSSVFLTWKLSFDQISKEEPRAADILSLIAFLDGQGIPEMLLRQNEHLDVEDTSAIGTLLAFSLITAERDDETYSMHRLVQLSTQNWLSLKKIRDTWEEKALELISKELPNGEYENRKKFEALSPHAIAVLKYSPTPNSSLLRADILYHLAWFDWRQGRYKHATTHCKESYSERERTLGLGDPKTLDSLGLLASTYWSQGRWKEAEDLEVQVMETSLRVLGQEHPNTLTSMDNLASTYWNQGRWKEAEDLEVQVMETRKRVLGQEHPDTLNSMNNLASTYWNQGRWKEAEDLEVQVMETRKRVLGQEHPDTLTSMNNLASTYQNQGRWKEAEDLEVQVMETRKRVLGQEHPDTLASMNNLAFTWKSQGQYKEALQLIVECSQLQKRILGPDHPYTISTLNTLNEWQMENLALGS